MAFWKKATHPANRHPPTRKAVHVDNFHSQMLSANSEVLSGSDAHLFSAELQSKPE